MDGQQGFLPRLPSCRKDMAMTTLSLLVLWLAGTTAVAGGTESPSTEPNSSARAVDTAAAPSPAYPTAESVNRLYQPYLDNLEQCRMDTCLLTAFTMDISTFSVRAEAKPQLLLLQWAIVL